MQVAKTEIISESIMSLPVKDQQINPQKAMASPSRAEKPVVVGLYGLPGSGKTHLLDQLKQEIGQDNFTFHEGSQEIANVCGGLDAFNKMEETKKEFIRQRAIDSVRATCVNQGTTAIVAGHYMFWEEGQNIGKSVVTQKDLEIYTHILYLQCDSQLIAERREKDTKRIRSPTSAIHLEKWQHEEISKLRKLCREHAILFATVPSNLTVVGRVSTFLGDFRCHNKTHNQHQADTALDNILPVNQGQVKSMLVVDGDKTLTEVDTGMLFWEKFSKYHKLQDGALTLRTLLSGPLKHSYTAFRQATLLYEEVAEKENFDTFCSEIASMVTMHPEFVCLLRLATEQEHVSAAVVTSGLNHVWKKVLKREGLAEKVKVIGGTRIEDGFVVTAKVKGKLVGRLRDVHHMNVWAFGDSPLDIKMLKRADEAVVVVGTEQTRSKGMDDALRQAMNVDKLKIRQVLLPEHASPRLEHSVAPITKLTDPGIVDLILCGQYTHGGLRLKCATNENATKLLATAMRDSAIAGPRLREAHRRVGWHLALKDVADIIGLEQVPLQHVTSRVTMGYQLLHEEQTTIVALMRGGEPMASGVGDAFPLAMFAHAKEPEDLKSHHLDGQINVILVDSVINTGKSIVDFVQRVRQLHATIRIVVVAGVIQAKSVLEGSKIHSLALQTSFHLIGLRTSETSFVGSRATDTGNRLFNTTHLP